MIWNKRQNKRTIGNIGEHTYDFKLKIEKAIYAYLCCSRSMRKEQKMLDKNLKFNLYTEWKKYINDKYKNRTSEELQEFSRYLNLLIRNNKPISEYSILYSSVILTVSFDGILAFIVKNIENVYAISFENSIVIMIIITLILGIIMAFLSWIIWKTLTLLCNGSIEENMLKDYKEIIDNMIGR